MDLTDFITVVVIVNLLVSVKLLIGQHRIARNQIELAEFIRERTGGAST